MPRVERSGALDIAYMHDDCNSSHDFHVLFQKSVNGGASFLPHAVTVERPGEWRDNPNAADLLPHTAFRAPESESLAYSPATGSLTHVVANSIMKATTGTDISAWQSRDGGLTWTHATTLSATGNVAPGPGARGDQFMPWIDATPSGTLYAIWFDRRRD